MIENMENAEPIFQDKENNTYMHINENNVRVLAISTNNCNCTMVFSLLYQLV